MGDVLWGRCVGRAVTCHVGLYVCVLINPQNEGKCM